MTGTGIQFVIVSTGLGPGAIVKGPSGLLATILPGLGEDRLNARIREEFPDAVEEAKGLLGAARAFERYFATGRIRKPGPRLDLTGVGEFDAAVYDALVKIPRGETITYAELARRIGRPGANRAVGAAVARNRIPVFIPCHRVVKSDGGLGGYREEGGIGLKRAMLGLEQRD